MQSGSRRRFLSRAFQISTGAALTTMAGCMGSGGNSSSSTATEKPKAIENISFAGTKMNIEFAEEAVGKTINLLPPNGNDPIRNWPVEGGKTSTSFSLVESTAQGTMPIPSGEYSIQVVKDTEVVNKRSVTLKPEIELTSIDDNSTPPNSFKISIKLSNHGTLPVHIDDINVSSVPEPASKNGMSLSRSDSNSMMIQNGIGIDKTATFSIQGYPFALGTNQEMHNYTVGNSSSRKCDNKQREATLFVKTARGKPLGKSFTYSLSGELGAAGVDYYCGNFSVSFPETGSETAGENQTPKN